MNWTSKLLEVCQRYGGAAKFAVTTVLGAVLPGSPAVVSLIESAFDTVEQKAERHWEHNVAKRLDASDADLVRLGGVLDVLLGDLATLTSQVAQLENRPDIAAQAIDAALAADANTRASAQRLESLAVEFDRLHDQQRSLLAGQEEMRPLLQRAVGICDYVEELRAGGFSAESFGELLHSFQKALRLLGQGQVAQAETALAVVSAARPLSAAATVALAAAQSAGHQFLLAEQTLTRACRLRPDDRALAELHQRVTLRSRHGNTPSESVPFSDQPPRVGDVLDGWTLEALVGHGGWGMVFKGTKAGRTIALKVMHGELAAQPHFVDRFKREIMTLARLGKQPHLVEIDSFGYATSHGCWYLAMEWIEGETLEVHLARQGPLKWEKAQPLFCQLADGLAAAHARGVVHRDVKPANILIRPDGSAVLVDFGLALEGEGHLTRTGRSAGYTALFAAPEQIRTNHADARSDVYSLAASLYYALLYDDAQKREPHRFKPRHVPEAMREVLTAALDNDPAERPADAATFRISLHEARQGLIVDAAGQGTTRSLAEAIRRARDGAEIHIRPGHYEESLIVDKSVRLIGDGPRERIVIASLHGICLRVQGGAATVSGVTLLGHGGSGSVPPTVDVVQGQLTLSECEVRGGRGVVVQANGTLTMQRSAVRDSGGAGVLFEGGGGLLEDCEIHGSQLVGVQVRQRGAPTLRRCRIHQGRQGGLLFSNDGGGLVEECEVFANSLSGVDIKTGGDPVLRRCTIHGNRTNGVYVYEQGRGTLEDCEIHGNQLQGVAVKERGDPVLRRCVVRDGRECGVFVYERGAGTFDDCQVFGNTLSNVEIKEANPILRRCTIRNGHVCGVLVWVNGAGVFEECRIHDNTYAGAEVKQGGDPRFVRCLVKQNGGSAFYVHERGTATVEGCDLRDNKLGAWDLKDGCRVRRINNNE